MSITWRMRVVYRIMVAAERVAQWARLKWVKWHDTRGVILPDDTTPAERPW